jgi:nickel-dependent lactate racemase
LSRKNSLQTKRCNCKTNSSDTKHYDPAKEAAKPQWKKSKKPKDKKKATHIYFISSSDEEEPEPPMDDEPPMAGSSSGGHGGPVHTYFSDSD